MYKKNSQNLQNTASRISLRHIPGIPAEIDQLSIEEQKEILSFMVRQKQEEILKLVEAKPKYKRDGLKEALMNNN